MSPLLLPLMLVVVVITSVYTDTDVMQYTASGNTATCSTYAIGSDATANATVTDDTGSDDTGSATDDCTTRNGVGSGGQEDISDLCAGMYHVTSGIDHKSRDNLRLYYVVHYYDNKHVI